MERKELPEDVTLPDESILTRKDYERIYHIASQDDEFTKLKSLYESTAPLDDVMADTPYQQLIDAGLAVRQSGAGDPYVRITSLGETLVEHGVEDGIRELIRGEQDALERYSLDS